MNAFVLFLAMAAASSLYAEVREVPISISTQPAARTRAVEVSPKKAALSEEKLDAHALRRIEEYVSKTSLSEEDKKELLSFFRANFEAGKVYNKNTRNALSIEMTTREEAMRLETENEKLYEEMKKKVSELNPALKAHLVSLITKRQPLEYTPADFNPMKIMKEDWAVEVFFPAAIIKVHKPISQIRKYK